MIATSYAVAFVSEPPKIYYTSSLDGSSHLLPSGREAEIVHLELKRAGEMIRELRAEIEAIKVSTPSLSNGGA